jgi:putative nucleotidyltransferase with HDIG domain
MEARDPYTKGHSDRVAAYSEKIGRGLGLAKARLEVLKEAALLHDIGKLGVQESILNKKMKLTDDERSMINKHPAIGEEVLKPIAIDDEMIAVIRQHHEHYDGSGYPAKLKGGSINLLAAIVAVADAYDAMTSHRAYRNDLSKKEAVRQLEDNKGIQFDPKVVDAFVEVLKEE